MEPLYNAVIMERVLTTKVLNNLGYNNYQIKKMVSRGILEKVKRGQYVFKDIDGLLEYRELFIKSRDWELARKCFNSCYKLDPNHSKVLLKLLLEDIRNKKFDLAWDYLTKLKNKASLEEQGFYSFCLYLLGQFREVPEEHEEFIKNLKIEDIKFNSDDNVPLYNKVQIFAFNKQYTVAIKLLNDLIAISGTDDKIFVVWLLLANCIEAKKDNKNQLLEFAKEKQYGKIIKLLEKKRETRGLAKQEEMILKITYDIVELLKTGEIPPKKEVNSDYLTNAIQIGDYELAIDIYTKFLEERNFLQEKSPLYILLNDICSLISRLKLYNTTGMGTVEQNNIELPNAEEVRSGENNDENISVNVINPNEKGVSESTLLTEFMVALMGHDITRVVDALREYLTIIGKRDYEFLLIDLIKISMYENDYSFVKPLGVITAMINKTFFLDIDYYIFNFKQGLDCNLEVARLYLDIIENGVKVTGKDISLASLREALKVRERENSIVVTENQESLEMENETKLLDDNAPKIEVGVRKDKEDTSSSLADKTKKMKEYLDRKYDEMQGRKGLVLLRDMNKEERNLARNIVSEYENASIFFVGDSDIKTGILRYHVKMDEWRDLKELRQLSYEAFQDGDYNSALQYMLEHIEVAKVYPIFTYWIANSYFKMKEFKLAIEYYKITTLLAKKHNTPQYDKSTLVAYLEKRFASKHEKMMLKREREFFECKNECDMDVSEFNNNLDYYGISNIVEITDYIASSDLSMEEAVQELGISEEAVNLLRIIYAREYFTIGDYENGDYYLRKVEKSEIKTPQIINLLNELRRDKMFYINRNYENRLKITLPNVGGSRR